MFYAIRTQNVFDNYEEKQLLKFYTLSDRNNFLDLYLDSQKISYKDSKKLQFCNTSKTCINKEIQCVYFVQRYI
jgi:hypothetical protein